MRITIDVSIMIKDRSLYAVMRKELETEIIPIAGMDFEDSAWEKPVSIDRVTCDFEENSYYITVPTIELATEDECKKQQDMMRLHGWKKAGE